MEPSICAFCSLNDFESPSHFREHESWCRLEQSHMCYACSKSFPSDTDLALHVLQHTHEEPSACPYCVRRIPKNILDQHFQKHHGIVPSKGVSIPLVEAFNRQVHFNVVDSQAEVAPAGSFESLIDFILTGNPTISPLQSPIDSSEDDLPSNDLSTPRPGRFPCNLCGMVFSKISYEIKHRKSHLSDCMFPCQYCDKTFTSDRGVNKHLLRMHLEHFNTPITTMSDYNMKFRPFKCVLCERLFRKKYAIQRHVVTVHNGHLLRFPYIIRSEDLTETRCPVCKKHFEIELMEKHECCGNPDKNFQCEKCSVYFDWKGNLMDHIKRKHEDDPPIPIRKTHKCEICDATFTNTTHLRDHALVHTNTKPFICQFCNRAVKSKRSLRTHIRIIHKISQEAARVMVNSLPDYGVESDGNRDEMDGKQELSPPESPVSLKKYTKNGDLREKNDALKRDLNEEELREVRVVGKKRAELPVHFYGNNRKNLEIDTDDSLEKSEIHQCPNCFRAYKYAKGLKEHSKDCTPLSVMPNYACPKCGRTWRTYDQLQSHLSRHVPEIFKCQLCSESFLSVNLLRRHLMTSHSDSLRQASSEEFARVWMM